MLTLQTRNPTMTTMTMKINPSKKNAIIITAAGSSTRMGLGKKKEYLQLGKGTVLSQAAIIFLKTLHVDVLVITIPQNQEKEAKEALYADKDFQGILGKTKLVFTSGGKTRQESVLNGLLAARKTLGNNALVLIHDGARPFVTEKIIRKTHEAALLYKASVPAIGPVDTQKEIDENNNIARHLQRKMLAAVQTPQGFDLDILIKCHKKAMEKKLECTDDTEIWDSFPEITGGQKVHVVEGDIINKKITFASDIIGEKGENEMEQTKIGMGTDLHKLVEGRRLILGGVEIPSDKGCLGHSDADVLLHSISDALLGAAGLGDIGSYFPPESPQWKDADSALLLKKIWDDVKKEGWELNNLDCVLEMEKPKFLPWRNKVIESIAGILQCEKERVFVKAKTNEKLDSVGQGLAVKAYCVCLLTRRHHRTQE